MLRVHLLNIAKYVRPAWTGFTIYTCTTQACASKAVQDQTAPGVDFVCFYQQFIHCDEN